MNGESEILYDTSALIELFLGSDKGEVVKELFVDENTANLVPSVVLLELISKITRAGKDPKRFVALIEQNCTVLALTSEIAKNAGNLHAELKKKDKQISMADCVIMAHAEIENALIVSKDQHFKHYKNSKIL